MKITDIKVDLVDYMGSDLSVVNAARVSFAKESDWEYDVVEGYADYEGGGKLSEKDQKLITYLARNNHWTPFAHTCLSFRVKAPIFVARQLAKHQVGLVWNEVSRRYVDDEPEFFFPKEWRGKPVNAKQGSSDKVITELYHAPGAEDLWGDFDNKWNPKLHVEAAVENVAWMYNHLLESGVAPEQARMVLPQNTMSEWIWTGSLAAFARVCNLRLDPHAQEETRQVAVQINELIPKEFKHSWSVLIDK